MKALLEHVRSEADLEQLMPRLPDHWIKKMFVVGAFLKLRMFQEGFDILEELSHSFPSSEFVVASVINRLSNFDSFDRCLFS